MPDSAPPVRRARRLLPIVALAFAVAACDRAPPVAEAPKSVVAPAPAPAAAPPAGKPAAKPEVPTLSVDTWGGGHFDLAAQRGKWVVVNFWATWCNPCLKEIPDLAEFDAKRDDVQVIGLAYEEIEKPDMEAFLKEHPIPYPFAVVDVYSPPPDFDTPVGLPMTYLIAPDGKVAKKFLGPTTSAELAKLIDEAGKARS